MNYLDPKEKAVLAEIIQRYLSKETTEYNSKRRIFAEKGDLLGLNKNIETYLNQINEIHDFLSIAVDGLKKTKMIMKEQSNNYLYEYLDEIYKK